MRQGATQPEFSRAVRIDDLPLSGRKIAAEAAASEREALARRLGLAALSRLEVDGEVAPVRGGTVIRLSARLFADVTQTCVVTLVPLERRIDAEFVRLYAVHAQGDIKVDEEVFFDEEDEDIEPLVGNRIDIGEAAAEQLALELDPYPRAPDAVLPLASDLPTASGQDEEPGGRRPFAGLAGLTAGRQQKKRK